MTLLSNATFVCLDCEFTGLDLEKDRIIEVAAVRFSLSTLFDQYETLINPHYPISEDSQKVHHISQEMIEGKPSIDDILPKLISFLGDDIIVGHAVGCDLEMIAKEARRMGLPFPQKERPLIDTLRLARQYGDSPNNSLSSLAQHFNIGAEGKHRAMNDVLINIDVFKYLIQRFKTVDQLMKILAHPIQMKYMPLGKHKGRLFSEIPLHYLQWASHADFDQDLLFSIRLELKKRKKGDTFSHLTNPFSEL